MPVPPAACRSSRPPAAVVRLKAYASRLTRKGHQGASVSPVSFPPARAVRALLARPRVVDATIAGLLLLMMVAGLVSKTPTAAQHANDAGAYLLAVGMAAPYVFHRRAALISLAFVLGSLLVYSAIGYAAFPGVNAFVLLFAISIHSDRRRAGVAFAATALTLLIAVALQPAGVVDRNSAIFAALGTVIAWLGGDNLRQRRVRWAALRERNELLEREREDRARQAVLEERLRIARELHDVVAHAMSVIAVQAGVGSHVGLAQPAEAQRSLATIETTSRSALVEMRRMLGVLRSAGDAAPATTAPSPGLGDVPGLISQVRDGGLTACLHITGGAGFIPPGVDLSAYRIIQEALTNAIKHGGPNAQIMVAYSDDAVSVEVTSDASADHDRGQHVVAPGHGIIGMRERVALFGGDFSSGPRPGGGFRVAARLPFEGGAS